MVRTFAQATASPERWTSAIDSEPTSVWSTITRTIAEAIPDTCLLCLADEATGALAPVAVHDDDPRVCEKLRRTDGPCARATAAFAETAMEQGTIYAPVIELVEVAVRDPEAAQALRELGARSLVVVPLRGGGQLYGVLAVIRHDAQRPPLDELDVEILEDLGGHTALAISNALLVQKLKSGEALRETTQFLDAVIENIPDMVFVKEAEGLTFVRMNRAGEQLLGIERGAPSGKTSADLYAAHHAAEFRRTDRETLDKGELVEVPETLIDTPLGPRWMHTKKVPLFDARGVPRYLLGISRDISERKRTESQLRAAKQTLEDANRELLAFVHSLTHDLRAPLRVIQGYGDAMLEDGVDQLAPQQRDYLRRMTSAASHMAGQIDELLALARVGEADLVRSQVDLTAIAHSVVGGLRNTAKQRDVEVTIEPGLQVEADRHMMAIVLSRLVDNAWKFTSRRAIAHIEIGRIGNAIFVRDDGVGFDERYLDQLFGVFRRLHTQDEFSGVGIGLAIVARIIHRHNGRVWARGQPDAGATFHFTVGESL